jgi:HEAT repeat protein
MSGEAPGAHASQTKLESVSTHGPAGLAPSAVQPASESVGGQPEWQEPGETSGEAFDAHAQQTKLAEIGSAVAADQATLRNYLRDPDPIIGAAAFDALGIGDKRAAVEALLEVVNDPTEPVRLQALQLVLSSSDLEEETWVATLRAALADPDPAFAACATQALGGLEIDPAADDATFRYHLRDPDPAVGAAAFDALGVRNKEAAVGALLEVVNDPTEPVRLQALQLLLGSLEAGEATLAATLRTALADPDSAIVACAVQELGGRDDAEAISALAEALGAGDLPTRLLIVQSIASNTSAVPLLHQGLEDPDETVRTAATAVLFPSEKTKD